MIAIRVDANEHIASGHLVRCLSIADALFSLGEEVVFYTSDEFAEQMIINHGFKVICLHNDWSNKESEIDPLRTELEKSRPRLLLIDSYQVTERYLKLLRQIVKLAYIDDLNAFDYPVDMVINYSIYAEDLDYPKNKDYILGMQYAPLRKQFDISDDTLDREIRERSQNKQILLTTGASDLYHTAGKIIDTILSEPKLDSYRIVVVKGKFWDDPAIISKAEQYMDRLTILENVENMAELMLQSTMAVSAGGSTLYELCACCVPTVTFASADNQFGNVKGFEHQGLMSYAGDARDTDEIGAEVAKRLLTYHDNDDIIQEVTNKMGTINCRAGAKRIAESFLRDGCDLKERR